MQTNYDTLKNVLDKAIEDECTSTNLKVPDIKDEEWFTVFDVLEAHYLANNMMDKYLDFIYWYVRVTIHYAQDSTKEELADMFGNVYISSGSLDNIENVIRYQEGPAVCEEIKEKLAKLNKKTNQNNYDEVNLDPTSSQVKKRTLTRIEDDRFRRRKLK